MQNKRIYIFCTPLYSLRYDERYLQTISEEECWLCAWSNYSRITVKTSCCIGWFYLRSYSYWFSIISPWAVLLSLSRIIPLLVAFGEANGLALKTLQTSFLACILDVHWAILALSGLDLLFNFPAAILLALMLNEVRSTRFKRTIQTVSYMPHFISMVVAAGLIKEFCDSSGVISSLAVQFGGKPQSYISQPQYFRSIFTISEIWKSVGFNSIVYLAALSGISEELYEAARIDGAGRWRQLFHVTFPGLLPTIIIMLILRCGAIMNVNFEKVLLLYSPSTYSTADIISTYVYRMGIIKQNRLQHCCGFIQLGNQPDSGTRRK